MDHQPDLGDIARAVIDANLYMILGTAGDDGHPWVTPVYYSAEGYTDFYWVSSPESMHSRNIAARPQVSIVIFNSQTPIGTAGGPVSEGDVHSAQAVYMSGVAQEVTGVEVSRGVDIFSRAHDFRRRVRLAKGRGQGAPEGAGGEIGGGLPGNSCFCDRSWPRAKGERDRCRRKQTGLSPFGDGYQ